MRRIKMSDQDKIRILKSTNIITVTALVITNIGGKIVLDAYEQNRKKLTLAHRMLNRFVELSPEEVSAQVMREFEFEWITKDLNPPDFPKGKL